jgi:hypothetical protein
MNLPPDLKFAWWKSAAWSVAIGCAAMVWACGGGLLK